MSPSRVCAFLLLAGLVLLVPQNSVAQLPPNSSTTATPIPGSGHDYLGGQIDTVNPASGSVSVRIPVIMPPSRGITLPFFFAYDSSGVNYLTMAQSSGTAFWKTIGTTIAPPWPIPAPVPKYRLLAYGPIR